MIYTASINNCNTNIYPIISIDRKSIKNNISFYSLLIPNSDILELLNSNNIEDNKKFIRKFYLSHLSKIDLEKLYNDLNNCIITSTEEFYETSIRHIVSAYLELSLNIDVPEVSINNNEITKLYRPEFIKDEVKKLLLENKNMI